MAASMANNSKGKNMDPNANLAELRRLLAKDSDESTRADLERIAELAAALDEWISGGGFLPLGWQRQTVWEENRTETAADWAEKLKGSKPR